MPFDYAKFENAEKTRFATMARIPGGRRYCVALHHMLPDGSLTAGPEHDGRYDKEKAKSICRKWIGEVSS